MSPPAAPPVWSPQRLVRPFIVGVVITAGAYAALMLLSDWSSVSEAAQAVPLSAVLAALAASTGNFALRWARWVLYLRRVGVSVPAVDSGLVFLSGFSMSLTPGKVGELLKPAMLHDRYGAPLEPVGSVVIAERITDLLAVAALLGVGALAEPKVAAIAGLVWLGVGGGIAVLAWPRLAEVVVGVARRLPAGDRIAGIAQRLLDSLRDLNRPATLLPALGLSVGAWGLQCVSLYLVCAPMAGLDISPLASILAYTAPLLAGAAALVPGGVGVAEASMVGLLVQLGDGTVSDTTAATAITRAATLWWAVVLGLGGLLAWSLRRPRD